MIYFSFQFQASAELVTISIARAPAFVSLFPIPVVPLQQTDLLYIQQC